MSKDFDNQTDTNIRYNIDELGNWSYNLLKRMETDTYKTNIP